MPKYQVWGKVTGTKYLGEFEASTPEEAGQMATDSDAINVRLCHACKDQIEDPEIEDVIVEISSVPFA